MVSITRLAPTGAIIAALVAIAVPGPAAAAWDDPVRISPMRLSDPAIAVDASGDRHLVARGEDGLWYFTDASGDWRSKRLTRDGPLDHGERVRAHGADIAVDPVDGSIVVAWVRSVPVGTGGCDGTIRYRVRRDDGWTATRRVPASNCVATVDVAARGGVLTIAAEIARLELQVVEVVTGRPGAWTSQILGRLPGPDPVPMSIARSPSLALDAVGRPKVAYERAWYTMQGVRSTIRWARPDGAAMKLRSEEAAALTPAGMAGAVDLALDRAGRPRIAWIDGRRLFLAVRQGGDWTVRWVGGARYDVAIAIDRAGRTVIATANGWRGLKVWRPGAGGWAARVVDEHQVVALGGLVTGADGYLHLAWQRSRSNPHVSVVRAR